MSFSITFSWTHLTTVLCALHFCVFESEKWDFHTALSNTLLLICRKILIIDTLYSSFIYLVNYLFIYLFMFWLRRISLELTSVPVFPILYASGHHSVVDMWCRSMPGIWTHGPGPPKWSMLNFNHYTTGPACYIILDPTNWLDIFAF